MKAGAALYLGVVVFSVLAAASVTRAPGEVLAAHNAAGEPAINTRP
ncbi:hypothetical protein [Roseateles asaccharophilus]|uniref:Uncharacterized protein n=1 Tax=Roseateles asaccharophilus TaxID=582607 RepID=A0ABU2AEQ0_9BURK|nr:hypothetical protein [Roseateles asaccharophilus]MDR7335692.1 hypothetical protein [Roseateles asaccharophilus]